MNNSCLENLKKRFAEIQDNLQRLKEQSVELGTAIESGRLVQDEAAEQLKQTLQTYQEQLASLQTMGKELSINTSGSLSDIRSNILAAEERERLNIERHLILDYFRLTAEAGEVRFALEESKRHLMEKCKLAVDESTDVLKPFIIVVKRTAEGKNRLPDDEYDAVEQGISRAMARALDRHDLSIDSNFAIDEYLDGSCALLNPEDRDLPERTECVSEPSAPVAPEQPQTQASSPKRYWPDFEGYMDLIGAVEFGEDTKIVRNLEVQKGHSLFSKNPMVMAIFELLGYGHLLPDAMGEDGVVDQDTQSQLAAAGIDCTSMSIQDAIHSLQKQGYLRKVAVKKNGTSREFLTLSSRGWACLAKPAFKELFKPGHIIPADLRLNVSALTPENVLCLVAFLGYFARRSPQENYEVFCLSHFLFSMPVNGGERVVAAIFEAGNEEKNIVALQGLINVLQDSVHPDDNLRIIVSSEKDIPYLEQELDFSKTDKNQVRYCILEGSSLTLLDHDGQPVDPAKPEAPTETQPELEPESQTEPEPHPEPEAQPEPEPESEPDLRQTYIQKGWELLARGKNPEALTLFRALSRYSKEDKQSYRQLAYALDDPSFRKSYRYTDLIQAFPDGQTGNLGYDALELAAYLRLFFSRDIQSEQHYDVKNIVPALEGNAAYGEATQLRELVYKLCKMFSEMEHGFEPEALTFLTNAKGREEQVNEYRKKAQSLLDSRLEEGTIGNSGVRKTRKALFGSGAELRSMLEKVAAGNAADAPEVRKTVGKYQGDGFIDNLLDATWEGKGGHGKGDKLTGSARKTILNKFREIIDTCLTWASMSEASGGSNFEEDKEKYIRYQAEVKELCGGAEKTLEARIPAHKGREAVALGVLESTLKELRERLDGKFDVNRDRFFFLPFLKGNFVELGEDFIPDIEADFGEVSPFNLCKRIVEQSEMEDTPWTDVLRRIFEDAKEGRDYGHAKLIREYLSEAGESFNWPQAFDIEKNAAASKKALEWEYSRFIAQLDMAVNYEWVDNASRIDAITADMEKRRQRCNETQNYGFCLRTMEAYLRQLEREAEKHKAPGLREQLRLLREGGDTPILDYIGQLIDERMYTVAQDYMGRVTKEGLKERPGSALLMDGKDDLALFINHYMEYYRKATDSEHTRLSDIYRRDHRREDNNRIKTGCAMLDAWPKSMGSSQATAGKIKELFDNMGLPVKDVQWKDGQHFLMTFREQEPSTDYPHPIGAYGCEMIKKGLNVFLLFGRKNDTTMNSSIRELMNSSISGASVILADTQLSLSEKRKLTQTIKEKQNQTPCLLIDRVTILHLAEQQKTERWKVFLKCALPFHYLNPFTENSSVEICPDMFIGRRDELNKIIAPDGANIIYGGRQLGKTALLHHAHWLENVRPAGKWSVFIDIKTESALSTAVRIHEELQDVRFLPKDKSGDGIDWPGLVRKIVNRIRSGTPKVEKFLLLLDEADNFLADCQTSNYQPVDYLKQIQAGTQNRFKFVLAGLHNVIRFHDNALGSNSPLAHLGTITVKPLPFREARELLEKPLSYLGFRLGRENISLIDQILSSTNYYPGLVQFYASRLVKSIRENYGDVNTKPPYELREDQILTLLKNEEFKANIRDKFMITLGIDQGEEGYYETLAYVLAYCYCRLPNDMARGYTAEQIVKVCDEFQLRSITDLSPDKVRVLLDELSVLNVLHENEMDGVRRYTFNRISFRHMLGDEEAIDKKLVDIWEKDEKRNENASHAQ